MEKLLFDDLLVIDCASFVAGPAAATILSDFGARVIKIEPPGAGDSYRQLFKAPGVPQADRDYFWTLTSRNKESVALDLKQESARFVLATLVRRADIFVTNYPPPIRAKLKLTADDLMPLNDRLIYASLTPYGETGPEKDRQGYDATAYWARSGLMDLVRPAQDAPPGLPVPAMGDHPTAVALFASIVTALYRRQITGKGGVVSTSLLANGLWANGAFVQAEICGTDLSTRYRPEFRSALRAQYQTRDQRWFAFAIINGTRDWPILAAALGQPEWGSDPRYATFEARQSNADELQSAIAAIVEKKDWSEWSSILSKAGIPTGFIAKTADHLNDPQVAANNMLPSFADAEHLRTVDSPVHVAGATKRAPRMAPEIGQHTRAVLAELGLTASAIEAMVESGAAK